MSNHDYLEPDGADGGENNEQQMEENVDIVGGNGHGYYTVGPGDMELRDRRTPRKPILYTVQPVKREKRARSRSRSRSRAPNKTNFTHKKASNKRSNIKVKTNGEEEEEAWEVDHIQGKRPDRKLIGKWEYRVFWKGWTKPTWEPEFNLRFCPETVQAYETSQGFQQPQEGDYNYDDDDEEEQEEDVEEEEEEAPVVEEVKKAKKKEVTAVGSKKSGQQQPQKQQKGGPGRPAAVPKPKKQQQPEKKRSRLDGVMKAQSLSRLMQMKRMKTPKMESSDAFGEDEQEEEESRESSPLFSQHSTSSSSHSHVSVSAATGGAGTSTSAGISSAAAAGTSKGRGAATKKSSLPSKTVAAPAHLQNKRTNNNGRHNGPTPPSSGPPSFLGGLKPLEAGQVSRLEDVRPSDVSGIGLVATAHLVAGGTRTVTMTHAKLICPQLVFDCYERMLGLREEYQI